MSPLEPSDQTSVIALRAGAHLLTAPPGSGKTHVLTQRIAAILSNSPSDDFRVLALTFTNKAAEELTTRLANAVGDDWRRVHARTFHGFCMDLVRSHGPSVGISADVSIFESLEDRVDSLAAALADSHGGAELTIGDTALSQLLTRISNLKRSLCPPENVDAGEAIGGVSVRHAYALYNQALRSYGAVDFDDLLLLGQRLLAEKSRIAQHYRRVYRYIAVDEAQDMSFAQYELLATLVPPESTDSPNVMLVADGDQSIYGFAGAGGQKFLQRFLEDYGASHHVLERNFRCAPAIRAAAARLIQHNPDALRGRSPQPRTAAEVGGLIAADSFPDVDSEARAVANTVTDLLRTGLLAVDPHALPAKPLMPSEVAVLGRSRFAVEATAARLDASGIPTTFERQAAYAFDSPLGEAVFRALRILANPRDVMSLRRLLATLSIDEPALAADAPSLAAVFDRVTDSASQGRNLWAAIRTESATAGTHAALVPLLCEIALTDLPEDDPDLGDRTRSDFESLASAWRRYTHKVESTNRTLSGFLAEFSALSRLGTEDTEVRVATIHAVKGLEFRAVVLLGMNDGTLPDFRANTPGAIEEERRSAYVAVTRASEFLWLTRPETRSTRYGERRQQPSRFLLEMGPLPSLFQP